MKFRVFKKKRELVRECNKIVKFLCKDYKIEKKWALTDRWVFVPNPNKYSIEYRTLKRGRGAWNIFTDQTTGKQKHWRQVFVLQIGISFNPVQSGLRNKILNDSRICWYGKNSNLEVEIYWTESTLDEFFKSALSEFEVQFDHGGHAPLYDCNPKNTISVDSETRIGKLRVYVSCKHSPQDLLKLIKLKLSKIKRPVSHILINYSWDTKKVGGVVFLKEPE